MPEINVLAFAGLTGGQQAIEKLWVVLIQELSKSQDQFEVAIPASVALDMGAEGIEAIVQRCKSFNDSSVEPHMSEDASTVKLKVLSAEAKRRQQLAQMLAGGTQTPKSIPRPKNCFILYRQHHHSNMVYRFPNMHNNQISQVIGAMWKSEPQAVRDEWKRKAELAKIEHERMYPNYQYAPRRPGTKKRRAARKSRSANENTIAADAADTDAAAIPQLDFDDQDPTTPELGLDNFPAFPEPANNFNFADYQPVYQNQQPMANNNIQPDLDVQQPVFPNDFKAEDFNTDTFNTDTFNTDLFPEHQNLEQLLEAEINNIMSGADDMFAQDF